MEVGWLVLNNLWGMMGPVGEGREKSNGNSWVGLQDGNGTEETEGVLD